MAYASPSDLPKSLSMKYLPSLRFFAGHNWCVARASSTRRTIC